MKLHTQRASMRVRKRWARKGQSRASVVLALDPGSTNGSTVLTETAQVSLYALDADVDRRFTVMVKRASEPRAKRLAANGELTTRKANALAFTSVLEARAAAGRLTGADFTVERAWAAPF